MVPYCTIAFEVPFLVTVVVPVLQCIISTGFVSSMLDNSFILQKIAFLVHSVTVVDIMGIILVPVIRAALVNMFVPFLVELWVIPLCTHLDSVPSSCIRNK